MKHTPEYRFRRTIFGKLVLQVTTVNSPTTAAPYDYSYKGVVAWKDAKVEDLKGYYQDRSNGEPVGAIDSTLDNWFGPLKSTSYDLI